MREKLIGQRYFVTILLVLAMLGCTPFMVAEWQRATSPLAELRQPLALTYEGALRVNARLGRYARALPPENLAQVGPLIALIGEVLPHYSYEGVSGLNYVPPVTLLFMPGERNFHVLGSYLPLMGLVALNARYASPWAVRWYGNAGMLGTLVHELAHAQGVSGGTAEGEAATQLVTVEVLAAMVRDGDMYALPSFLSEIRGFAMDYAHTQAVRAHRQEAFYAYVRRHAVDSYALARTARARDHWAHSPGDLERILDAYGARPYEWLIEALQDPELKTRVLRALPNAEHRLEMNDTAWVLAHLPALVRDYKALTGEED